MRLGARIFKTGLAVTLALYSALWLGFESQGFAALAAFLSVQPSVRKSVQLIWDQIQANLLSAALAVTFVLAFGHEPFVVGVVVMLVIAIHLKLKKEAIIPLAVVTAIVIMGSPTDDFIPFATNRFFLIFIGVISAFIVNLIFLPPKHENLLYHKLVNTNDQILQWIRLITRHEADYKALKKDVPKLQELMSKLEGMFVLYREERHYLRKNEYARMRKVVLFRQMVNSTGKSHRILKALSKYENELQHLPESMQDIIRDHLDYLTNYHERILLKYTGKVKAHTTEELYEEVGLGKRQLTELYLTFYDDSNVDRNEWIHFFPVIAMIIEYSEELERLDRLVDGFFTFHRSENKVKIREKEV
ncbi:aromatic acid exporter family protein [Evansella tamaricis]|uniref:FUSC family protein n=1 Tax=Evansella tamaricis TaxID=2069301 RepID=A0ABS6J9R0_9BACI|nr:aromatic acid exporter family protein [Evansella tamaricis]MBU9710190.1 FUSC family protein [Evansella tamaricis]